MPTNQSMHECVIERESACQKTTHYIINKSAHLPALGKIFV